MLIRKRLIDTRLILSHKRIWSQEQNHEQELAQCAPKLEEEENVTGEDRQEEDDDYQSYDAL